MKYTLAITMFIITLSANAQDRNMRIEDSVIGWQFKVPARPYKPFTAKGRTLTVGQKENMARMIEWMMKSYTPVGGTGTFKFILNTYPSGTYQDYRQHSYWVDFRTWNVGYDNLDANGHFLPISEEYHPFPVSFNSIPGTETVEFLNSPGNYYFIWPQQQTKTSPEDDPRIHPNLYKFITRNHTVILAPNNKLPFLEVTTAQYLDELEKSLTWNLKIEKDAKDEQFKQDNQAKFREEAYAQLETKFDGYRKRINELRKFHKNELNKQAILRDEQPSLTGQMSTNMDPFAFDGPGIENNPGYPLYKTDPAVMEKCRSDQPQWITFVLPYAEKGDGAIELEMYTALSQNVNYQYIYDYYFDPAKVKGIPYTPADEAGLKKRLAAYRAKNNPVAAVQGSATVNTKPRAANALLEEDFSATKPGEVPRGWYIRSYGRPTVVAKPVGTTGNWLSIGGAKAIPTTLPKPLPENFSLSYDVATDPDFSGRTGGAVQLRISSVAKFSPNGDEQLDADRQSIELRIVAGSETDRKAASNYRGLLNLEIHDTKGINKSRFKEGLFFKQPLTEFTSERTIVHVRLQVKAGQVHVFINDKELAGPSDQKLEDDAACIQCGVRPGTKFNTIYWTNVDDTGENKPVYISNIKLIKE